MKHKPIGEVSQKLKSLFGLDVSASDIRFSEEGLIKHMEKRGHHDVLQHIEDLGDILANPDYVGVNSREKGISLEYVKRFEGNVLVAIKLHKSSDFFYVPTMYSLQEYKLQARIKSGRLKKFDKNN